MDRIVFIFRLAGILFLPIIALVLGAVIWQNSGVVIDEFSLLGGWLKLKSVRLSDLLVWFLVLGAAVVLGFLLLLHNERRLRRKLVELRNIKKKKQDVSPKQDIPLAQDVASRPASKKLFKGKKAD